MVTGIVFLALGLFLALGSRQIARLQLWARGVTRLETTDPEVVSALQVGLQWALVLVGVSFALYGAKALMFGP